jgi:energy-coupling factor transporter ATP-binding protein EcfA2
MASALFSTLKLHASVIEKEGRALLFLGKSGTGKSTHSRLWQQYVPGCSLLNDDEPVVRVNDEHEVMVYGTPWSGKTPCYRNEKARVTAFVLLRQSPENRLTKLSVKEAFFTLFASSSMMRSDVHHKNAVFTTLAAILEHVPVYRLDCRPDREAVSLTESLLFL